MLVSSSDAMMTKMAVEMSHPTSAAWMLTCSGTSRCISKTAADLRACALLQTWKGLGFKIAGKIAGFQIEGITASQLGGYLNSIG